jgi:hypothetical protein
VARLANIPHGTSLVAQGIATPAPLPLVFPAVDITPFVIGQPTKLIHFPETDLATPTKFRTSPQDIPKVKQDMVDNPNVVLAAGLAGKTIKSITQLKVSTVDLNPPPSSGGGTSNISFLTGVANKPNANAAQMDATFWISDFVDAQGNPGVMLQYSQRVLLNFNGLSWPHVSVANLVKVY